MSDEGTGVEVLGLAGSPRRGGNSETLLDQAMEGARAAGARVRKIVLNELRFGPCQNCGFCSRQGVCRLNDDMRQVYEALDHADRIILASPIYFTNVSAQTKMMVDRCQPYWVRKYLLKQPALKTGRRGLFLCVGGFKKGRRFFACAQFLVRIWMLNLDVVLVNSLFQPGVDARGEIQKYPETLAAALAAGRSLVAQ